MNHPDPARAYVEMLARHARSAAERAAAERRLAARRRLEEARERAERASLFAGRPARAWRVW